jgi:RimJ/RimL family protein N-acetyltransferase
MPHAHELTDPGALLGTTHAVGGGMPVRLRLARPSDRLHVRRFLSGLSPDSRQARFGSADVHDETVREFTFFDPRERLVVAASGLSGLGEEILGLADLELLETGIAELGVVVDDASQGQGVGTLLTEVIASLALRRGAGRLRATLRGDNPPMQRLMEHLGAPVEVAEGDERCVYVELTAVRRAA